MRPSDPLVAVPGESLPALGVVALRRLFATGDATPRQSCDAYLNRIARCDGAIGAFVAVDGTRARHDADASTRRWARGEARSPIDGVPVAIKANIAVEGLPWTAGLVTWQRRIATVDAACVARLRAAGAVILGTLNMDAGALGATTDNPWYGRTHNPYDLDRSPGGSSGGAAAAVVAGLCAAALGTDTMGSVRIPAAACGMFAVVPPTDAIDRAGIVPLAPSFDRVGILARSLADIEAVLAVFMDFGSSRADTDSPFAIIPFEKQLAVDAAVKKAHERLASRMRLAGLQWRVAGTEDYEAKLTADQLLLLVEAEGAAVYADFLENDPEALGARLGSLLRYGAGLSAERRAAASQHVASSAATVRDTLVGTGGLISPTVPHLATAFGDMRKNTACFTAMASIADLATVVLPFADEASRLPQSLQVIARTTGDALHLGRRVQPCLNSPPPPSEFRWIAPPSLG